MYRNYSAWHPPNNSNFSLRFCSGFGGFGHSLEGFGHKFGSFYLYFVLK